MKAQYKSTIGINIRPIHFSWLWSILALCFILLSPASVLADEPIFADSGQTLGNASTYDVALGDLDGDGDLDAAVANSNEVRVWFNDGENIFTDSGQGLGGERMLAIALGDLDGDGDLDIITDSIIAFNNGQGIYTPESHTLYNENIRDITLGDLDNDGFYDAFVAMWGGNQIWRNNGLGSFSIVASDLGNSRSNSVSLGDLDGDGDLDAFVANINPEANQIWRNNGQGTFSNTGQDLGSSASNAVALGDLNGDGLLDAYVANDTNDTIYLNLGQGIFASPTFLTPRWNTNAVALGDLDGDGDLDAFTANSNDSDGDRDNTVWVNDGQGGFTDTSQGLGFSQSYAVSLGDLDNDGDLDAFVGNADGQSNRVWRNETQGIFALPSQIFDVGSRTAAAALGDLDSDGDLDLFIGNTDNPSGRRNSVWLNNGNGHYTQTTQEFDPELTTSVALGDLNNDGYLDTFVANDDDEGNQVYLNDGVGFFTKHGSLLGELSSKSVALGDLNEDGYLDAFVGNGKDDGQGQPNLVWLNDQTGIFIDSEQRLGNESTTAVALGDLNGDLVLDAFVGNGHGYENQVWFNDGQGAFIDSGQALQGYATLDVALGDLDGDGDLDVFIVQGDGEPNRVWFNDGQGNFIDSLQSLPSSVSQTVGLGDLDGDGDLDAVVGNGHKRESRSNQIWINDGQGSFNESTQRLGDSRSKAVLVGDLDGDGDLDTFIGNDSGDENEIYLNTIQNNQHLSNNALFLTATRPISEPPAQLYVPLALLRDTIIPVAYNVFDSDGDTIGRVEAQFSRNGGDNWQPAVSAFGGALAFDGEDDYVIVNEPIDLTNQSFTVMFWAKRDSVGRLERIVSQGARSPNQGLHIGFLADNRFFCGFWDNDLPPVTAYIDQNWHHWACTYDLNTGQGQIYRDGLPMLEADRALAPYQGSGPLNVGRLWDETRYFKGGVDEIQIWQGALTQSQIQRYMAHPPQGDEQSLIAYFPLNEGIGTTTTDQSTNTYDGILGGGVATQQPIWLDDAFSQNIALGTALGFDGIDDLVSIDSDDRIDPAASLFSVEAWIKTTDSDGGILFKGHDGFGDYFELAIVDDQAVFAIRPGGPAIIATSASSVSDGHWHHIVGVRSDVRTAQIYIDGRLEGTASNVDNAFSVDTNLPLIIGRSQTGNYFRGSIDEVRYWQVALTEKEIQQNRYRKFTGNEPGLMGIWSLNEGSGGTVFDQNANHNHGTLGNGLSGQRPKWVGGAFNTATYFWDTFASGFFGQSDNVVVRMVAYPQPATPTLTNTYHYYNTIPGPFQRPYASATTFPFRVRGTQVQVFSETIDEGNAVDNALVYRLPNHEINGGFPLADASSQPYRTNQHGYLLGHGTIDIGDTLYALAPVSSSVAYAGAVAFDGVDDFIEVNDAPGLNLGQGAGKAWSISLWYDAAGTSTEPQALIGKRITASGNSDYILFTENNTLVWGTGPSADTCAWLRVTEPSREQWHHLVATLEATGPQSGRKSLYIDGELVDSCDYGQKAPATSEPLKLGGAGTTPIFFEGRLDDVAMLSEAVTQADVMDLYNFGLSDDRANLIAYWPFDDSIEKTALDKSGNNHNGTLKNGATWISDYLGGYTVYHTNGVPDESTLNGFTVSQPGVQQIIVSENHPLILFDLNVSVEWDASKDAQFMQGLKDDLHRTSEVLFDATNGQAALGDVTIYHNKEGWFEAHLQVHATNQLRPNADIGGIRTDVFTDVVTHNPYITATMTVPYTHTYGPGQIRMGSVWNRFGEAEGTIGEDWPRTLVHELGHYLFYLNEDYLGLDENGLAVSVTGCDHTVMNDPYRDDFSEFHPPAGWTTDCTHTLQAQTNQHSDWETMKRWYTWLVTDTATITNPGPSILPIGVTQITEVVPTSNPTATIDVPIFYTTSEDGSSYTAGNNAQAILYQGERLIDLGSPSRDKLRTWGARPGDRLCVYELDAGRLGCEFVQADDDQLMMVPKPTWQPQIIVTPISSRTVAITVTLTTPPGAGLQARLFPVNDVTTAAIDLVAVTNAMPIGLVYTGSITLDLPADQGYIQVWLNETDEETNPRSETITSYSVGGNPGRGGLAFGRGGLAFGRPGSGFGRGGLAFAFSRSGFGRGGLAFGRGALAFAPIASSDGQVILFGNTDFEVGQFYALQKAALPPADPPPGRTLIGSGYYLLASPNAPSFENVSLNFRYLGKQVPPGEEAFISLYYYDGQGWQKLDTKVNEAFNEASAAVERAGYYAVMSSIEIQLPNPGWNLVAYPVQDNDRPVTEALASIENDYDLIYGYDAASEDWQIYCPCPNEPNWQSEFDTLATMTFGQGYWIHTTKAVTLYLQGTPSDSQTVARNFQNPPATYYGFVNLDLASTAGISISAWIDGNQCGETTTQNVGGQVMYVISVLGDGPGQPPTCGTAGKEVSFTVNGVPSGSTASWQNNAVQDVTLNPVADTGPASVVISGPTSGIINSPNTFTAALNPPSATPPTSYVWQPAPQAGQGTETVTYTWSTSGTYRITVSVLNSAGVTLTDHWEIIIGDQSPTISPIKIYFPLIFK